MQKDGGVCRRMGGMKEDPFQELSRFVSHFKKSSE